MPGGRLIEIVGNRGEYNLGMGLDILVSRFVGDNCWNLPPPTSRNLMSAWVLKNAHIAPTSQFHDEIVWILEDFGNFSIKSEYDALSGFTNQSPIPWVKFVWFKGCIPKHSLCAWMVFWGCLKTKDFPLQRGAMRFMVCPL